MADDLNLLHGTVTDGGGTKTFADPTNVNDGVLSSNAIVGSYAGSGSQTSYLDSDLGSAFEVAEHVVWGDYECSTDPTASVANGWSIQASDDGVDFDDVGFTAVEGGTRGDTSYFVRFILDAPETHRYWRFRYLTNFDGFHCGTAVATWEIFGVTSPTEPPVDPGYEVPEPGHAILEIYTHDEDATRWGTATWGDNPPTGTTGIWSGAGWQDVTPQGVRAHVSWGSSRPSRGILATQETAIWYVETYDPDRRLDPGNVDGPFYPQIVAGTPIRISHSVSGRVIRTGIIDEITYAYKAPEYRGTITASGPITAAHRADVSETAILGDTLDERVADAIVASGIAIGGIPLAPVGVPAVDLSPRLEGKASLWDHIRSAGEEVLHVFYENAAGGLSVRPWGEPLDRGSEVTYENLEDLTAISSPDGQYSVVYVTNADGSAEIERVAAPLPRYGRIPYTRRGTTIDPEAWADAVLADRAWPGVQFAPGVIWCFDSADVEYFASLEIMELLRVLYPGTLDVTGTILGMELWVEARTGTRSRWLFLPKITTNGAVSLGDTILVTDDTGEPLVDDEGDGDYLEYEG